MKFFNKIKNKKSFFHGQPTAMSTYQSRLLIIAAVPQLKIVMGAKFYDLAQISTHKKIRDYSAL